MIHPLITKREDETISEILQDCPKVTSSLPLAEMFPKDGIVFSRDMVISMLKIAFHSGAMAGYESLGLVKPLSELKAEPRHAFAA